MSGVARSVPEPDDPRAAEWLDGTCEMCHASGLVFHGAIELPDGDGWRFGYGPRCVETGECRKRRKALAE